MTANDVLMAAATCALRAPSVFNTQPWRWILEGDVLELRADRSRQLTAADPFACMLLASCGAALHHARLSIAAADWEAEILRLPDPRRPDVLAEIRLTGPRPATEPEQAMYAAIERRRTDRRPFDDEPVPDESIDLLRDAAWAQGTRLHRLTLSQMPMFAIAVARAGAEEMASSDYRNELMRWVNRPAWSGDGVPTDTTVRHVPRRVPVRELTLAPIEGDQIKAGGDRGSSYLVLFGDGDDPIDWLRAGEALSAVLLTAVSLGLSVAPISDVIEVPDTRQLVRGLVVHGHPYVAVRCGYGRPVGKLPHAPRREPGEIIRGFDAS